MEDTEVVNGELRDVSSDRHKPDPVRGQFGDLGPFLTKVLPSQTVDGARDLLPPTSDLRPHSRVREHVNGIAQHDVGHIDPVGTAEIRQQGIDLLNAHLQPRHLLSRRAVSLLSRKRLCDVSAELLMLHIVVSRKGQSSSKPLAPIVGPQDPDRLRRSDQATTGESRSCRREQLTCVDQKPDRVQMLPGRAEADHGEGAARQPLPSEVVLRKLATHVNLRSEDDSPSTHYWKRLPDGGQKVCVAHQTIVEADTRRQRPCDAAMPLTFSQHMFGSGGGGIRTHGGLPLTRFPSVPIRPLSHPSRVAPEGSGTRAICRR
mgnify:FL=1